MGRVCPLRSGVYLLLLRFQVWLASKSSIQAGAREFSKFLSCFTQWLPVATGLLTFVFVGNLISFFFIYIYSCRSYKHGTQNYFEYTIKWYGYLLGRRPLGLFSGSSLSRGNESIVFWRFYLRILFPVLSVCVCLCVPLEEDL